jgi:hypothetical protein
VTRVSRIRQWATVTLRKCARRVCAFTKQRFFFRPAHSG